MTGDVEQAASVEEVSRRLERYARTKDPAAMWPGVTETARASAAREVERVTRAVIAGETDIRIDPHGTHDNYALAIAGHATGMAPMLGYWIERGTVTASTANAQRFALYLDHARRRNTRMTRDVAPALDAFAAHDIPTVVLKGFHTAHAYFPEPGTRRMADVDLLVSPNRIGDAEAALRDAGFRAGGAALRPYKRNWIPPTVDLRVFSLELPDERNPWTIELHASLDRVFHPGTVARLDAERDHLERQEIAGRSLLVLGQPLLLLTLACHCSQELDGSRLLRLFEMVQVVRTDGAESRLDWDEVVAMVKRTRVARFTYPAFALVDALSPGTVDPRVLAIGRRDSTWAARHTVARLVPAGASIDHRGVVRQIMWVRGPIAVAQRLLRFLWPAAFTSPRGVGSGWRARLRRMRDGALSLRAPDERSATTTPARPDPYRPIPSATHHAEPRETPPGHDRESPPRRTVR